MCSPDEDFYLFPTLDQLRAVDDEQLRQQLREIILQDPVQASAALTSYVSWRLTKGDTIRDVAEIVDWLREKMEIDPLSWKVAP